MGCSNGARGKGVAQGSAGEVCGKGVAHEREGGDRSDGAVASIDISKEKNKPGEERGGDGADAGGRGEEGNVVGMLVELIERYRCSFLGGERKSPAGGVKGRRAQWGNWYRTISRCTWR